MARPDFRAVAARRLSEERELSPAIISLISPEKVDRSRVRQVPVDKIKPNPEQPRLAFDQSTLDELTASIKEHGVLQPILVRPLGDEFQLIAGERRWRASRAAGLPTIPALVEELDDDAAMEIAIIENLQREDLSPLDEATMYDRMIREHGYSVRKLAQKLGKDKGYVENRVRLADAPSEIKQLVSLRKDTISHAYELLKIDDQRKRQKLAEQVARGELTLAKLRDRIEGRSSTADGDSTSKRRGAARAKGEADVAPAARPSSAPIDPNEDTIYAAKQRLSDALDALHAVLRAPHVVGTIDDTDRANLAKYLTIAKIKLENAIVVVRSGEID